MTRVSFTGTRDGDLISMHREAVTFHVADALRSAGLGAELRFNTGGCVGFDSWAGQYVLRAFPKVDHHVYVPLDTSRVDPWWDVPPATLAGVKVHEGIASYRERNAQLVANADFLIAVTEHPEDDARSQRSGSWMTIRMARRAGVPGLVLVLSDEDRLGYIRQLVSHSAGR